MVTGRQLRARARRRERDTSTPVGCDAAVPEADSQPASEVAAGGAAVPSAASSGAAAWPGAPTAAGAHAAAPAQPGGVNDELPQQQLVRVDDERASELQCPWCHTVFPVKPRGRVPTWCSAACRQRAWEQARAAASGRSAVTVLERVMERVVDRVVVEHVPVPAPPPPSSTTRRTPVSWADQLNRLAELLDTGLLYDRDLDTLTPAIAALVNAYNRRVER